jgi:hypothetical protein
MAEIQSKAAYTKEEKIVEEEITRQPLLGIGPIGRRAGIRRLTAKNANTIYKAKTLLLEGELELEKRRL